MEALLNFLVLLGALLLVGTCLRLWLRAWLAVREGRPILAPLVPLPWIRWGLFDLGLLLLLIVGLQLVVASMLSRLPEPEQVIHLDQMREERAEKQEEKSGQRPGKQKKATHADSIDEEVDSDQLADAVPMSAPADPVKQQRLLVSMIVANLAWVLLGILLLRYGRGISFPELGIDYQRFGEDVRLGLAAFCMLAPPVYLLQLVLVQIWPSEHPLVDMIREDTSGRLLWMGAVAAVLVAPLFEEIAFRLFLQGWLENLVRVVDQEPLPAATAVSSEPGDPYWQVLLHGWSPGPRDSHQENVAKSSELRGVELRADSTERADSGLRAGLPREETVGPLPPEDRGPGPLAASPEGQLLLMPILVSSLIFALLHYSHGPDWIPLLFLAVGLGYLYQRTRRILPCILVHLLLNLTSFSMLLLEMVSGK